MIRDAMRMMQCAMCIYLCCFWCIIYSSRCVFFSFLSGEIVALVRYRLFCFLFFGLVIIGVKSFGGVDWGSVGSMRFLVLGWEKDFFVLIL